MKLAALGVTLVAALAFAQADAGGLVRLGDHPMRALEVERVGKLSTIKVFRDKDVHVGSVGSTMFVARALYEVAKARGRAYFINLKEWDAPDGSRTYLVGFTNVEQPDLAAEFGAQFAGKEAAYFSVKEYAELFEPQPEPQPRSLKR